MTSTPIRAVIVGAALALAPPAATPAEPWKDLTPVGTLLPDAPKPDFVSSAHRLFVAPELGDAPDDWIARSLAWTDFVLDRYPPGRNELPVRRAALTRLDDILHIASAPDKPAVQAYYAGRMARVIAEIETSKVTQGLRIWKIYNHGFIVRSPSVTIAFDLVPGIPGHGFAIAPALMARLADQADLLVISHRHPDHADADVAARFAARAKPVVVPEPLFAERTDLVGKLTVLRGPGRIALKGGNRDLAVVAYPGHQFDIPNNVTLVTTPEGLSVLHMGDEYDLPGGDTAWIDRVAKAHNVDVLIPNIWSNQLARMIRSARPALIVPGHENELAHPVLQREDYAQSYNRLHDWAGRTVVMHWGEHFDYAGR